MIKPDTRTDEGQHSYECMNGSLEWNNRSKQYELDRRMDLAVYAKIISWAMRGFYEASEA